MSVITFVCAGQMNSAITFPAFENGHEVRLVGSPLDREIIDGLKKDNYHITLKRTLHEGIKYYQIEELQEALEGADLILGGVSSFGLDWFCDEILPVLPEEVPLLTVTKGMVDLEDDYPLLMHVDEIINQGAEVNIPWEKFTMFVES